MRKLSSRPSRAAIVLGLALLAPTGARSDSAPDLGRPFEPTPASQALFAIRPPTDDNGQRRYVEAADGVEIFTESYLPAAKDGAEPPNSIPTILIMTPYQVPGSSDFGRHLEHLVPRGYAVTYAHQRGTGASGGCWQAIGSREIDDAARVIEYLGRDAPWSNGHVGMYGISYMGDIQVAVAGRGDPEKTKYLKAIVPAATIGNQYEINFFDGVPQGYGITFGNFFFNTAIVSSFRPETSLLHVPARLGCRPAELSADLDMSGDMTPYWQDHEYRAAAGSIRAAMLLVHGFADSQKDPAPLFESLPVETPHKLVTGWWEHTYPDNASRRVHPEWARADWLDMATAWFDRYLKGIPTGVEMWPTVQVQGSDGQWRGEPNWPVTGGPVGHLALGESKLGAVTPDGTTRYQETITWRNDFEGNVAIFESDPLADRLEFAGQPILDVWVKLSKPDAHIAARLEVLDEAGHPIPDAFTVGTRSVQHLEPLVDNRFAQADGMPAPVDVPIRVQVRLDVTDLVVAPGGRLRLTVGGSVRNEYAPAKLDTADPTSPLTVAYDPFVLTTAPSGAATTVTILHDCEHPSALRFLMPRANPDLLNVREKDEPADQSLIDDRPFVPPVSDAGGLATAPVCGQAPIRLENFGPEIAYSPPAG